MWTGRKCKDLQHQCITWTCQSINGITRCTNPNFTKIQGKNINSYLILIFVYFYFLTSFFPFRVALPASQQSPTTVGQAAPDESSATPTLMQSSYPSRILAAGSVTERTNLIVDYLYHSVCALLEVRDANPETRERLVNSSLMEVGLASLTGMQLKYSLEDDLHVSIPTASILEGVSIAKLAGIHTKCSALDTL